MQKDNAKGLGSRLYTVSGKIPTPTDVVKKTIVDNNRFKKIQKHFHLDILTNEILCNVLTAPFKLTS